MINGKKKNQLFDFFKELNSDLEDNGYEGQLVIDEGTLVQINNHANKDATEPSNKATAQI